MLLSLQACQGLWSLAPSSKGIHDRRYRIYGVSYETSSREGLVSGELTTSCLVAGKGAELDMLFGKPAQLQE